MFVRAGGALVAREVWVLKIQLETVIVMAQWWHSACTVMLPWWHIVGGVMIW